MIDPGLLGTLLIILVWMTLITRFVTSSVVDRHRLTDLVCGPVIVGFVVARLAAMAAENFGESLRLRDLALIRSGMEFWAGLAAGLGWAAWRWRGERPDVWSVFAAITPFGLWAYSLFEGTCLVRDGCLGPTSPIGLRPHGLESRVFPVGLAVAAVLSIIGVVLHRAWALHAPTVVFSGLTSLAVVRAVAGFWLPAIGASRMQRESVVAALVIPLVWLLRALNARRTARPRERDEVESAAGQQGKPAMRLAGADEVVELHGTAREVRCEQDQRRGGQWSGDAKLEERHLDASDHAQISDTQ